jgi:uncharacterized protein (TIGR03083 family)
MQLVSRGYDAFAACAAQWTKIADAVDVLPDEAFDQPSALPGWRVAELVAHLAMCASAPAKWLAEPAPASAQTDAAGYLLGLGGASGDIDQRTRERAAGKPAALLRVQARHAVDDLVSTLAGADPAQVIPSRSAPMRLDEFIVTRCVEGVVHGLDLEPPVEPDAAALRIVTKALLAALATKAPGHTVEVRVPPIAAVQVLEGPRHTRGTPSNVVETDPTSWVRLATGRLSWAAAAADGSLRASGERSDISGLLPLL